MTLSWSPLPPPSSLNPAGMGLAMAVGRPLVGTTEAWQGRLVRSPPGPCPHGCHVPLQFRRFQEVTLIHLQAVARNYNLSYSIDARFQSLAQESQALALAVNQSQATVQGDLGHLKTWIRKTQRRSQKVDSRLLALGAALRERTQQLTRERKEQAAQREALSSLALDMRALQDTLGSLTGVVQSQGVRLDALKEWCPVACPGTTDPAQPGLPSQSSLELQGDRQVLRTSPEPLGPPRDFAGRLQGTREPPGPGSQRAWRPESLGESKYHGPAFPYPPPLSLSLTKALASVRSRSLSPVLCGENTGSCPTYPSPEERGHPGDRQSVGPQLVRPTLSLGMRGECTRGVLPGISTGHPTLGVGLTRAGRIPPMLQLSPHEPLQGPGSAGTPWGLCPPVEGRAFEKPVLISQVRAFRLKQY